MNHPTHARHVRLARAARCRRGFSFTEVMFAVVLLGIGFIMVAAMLPVAIQQTQATSEEVTATSVGQNVAQGIPPLLDSDMLPATTTSLAVPATVRSIRNPQRSAPSATEDLPTNPTTKIDELWRRLNGSQISTNDPRFGWVGFYRRELSATTAAAPYADFYVVVCQSRRAGQYDRAADLAAVAGQPCSLQGWPISVQVADSTNTHSAFGSAGVRGKTTQDVLFVSTSEIGHEAVVEGAFVIIASDNNAGPNPPAGHWNGRMYQVGARRADLDVPPGSPSKEAWELLPGKDFTIEAAYPTVRSVPLNPASTFANAFVVGRQLTNPALAYNAATNPFAGPSQAVSAFSMTIPIPTR